MAKCLVSAALLDCNCIVELEVSSVVELPQSGKEVEHQCTKAGKFATGKVIKVSSAYWQLDDIGAKREVPKGQEELLPDQSNVKQTG